MRVTINNINAALPEGYSITRFRDMEVGGRFYKFVGPGCYEWRVWAHKLSQYSVDEWVGMFHEFKGETK